MNEKSKKNERNIIVCSINESDIKNFVNPSTMKNQDTEKKNKNHSKSVFNNKMRKVELTNNRSFSIELTRKNDSYTNNHCLSTTKQGSNVKETIESGIKISTLLPIKEGGSIPMSRVNKTRNTSENHTMNIPTNSKKTYSKISSDNPVKNHTLLSTQIAKPLINVTKSNDIYHKKNKSQTSSNNTPSSLKIIIPTDINFHHGNLPSNICLK
jgi:hypothetical protein